MAEKRLTFSADHDACGVGFIAQLGGPASHAVVERGLGALARLAHRGGVDADGRSGDGAGLLVGLPKAFFRKAARADGIELPDEFAVGMVFLQRGQEAQAIAAIRAAVAKFDLSFLGWRTVPTDPSILGPRSLDSLPVVRQCFLAPPRYVFRSRISSRSSDLELQLFRLRHELETMPASRLLLLPVFKNHRLQRTAHAWTVGSVLSRPERSRVRQCICRFPPAIFHQHATQLVAGPTLPFVAHNGEINTISSNRRWFQARAATLRHQLRLPNSSQIVAAGDERLGEF